jgi:ElaB/YqjD/DUF883 family membrane-anchored ribosome-binding protein
MATPNDTLSTTNTAANTMQDLVDTSRTRVVGAADATADLARRGIERARHASTVVRDTARDASDSAIDYTRKEPVKALAMAAVAGAAVAATVMLVRKLMRD